MLVRGQMVNRVCLCVCGGGLTTKEAARLACVVTDHLSIFPLLLLS